MLFLQFESELCPADYVPEARLRSGCHHSQGFRCAQTSAPGEQGETCDYSAAGSVMAASAAGASSTAATSAAGAASAAGASATASATGAASTTGASATTSATGAAAGPANLPFSTP